MNKIGDYTISTQISASSWEAYRTVYNQDTGESTDIKYVVKKIFNENNSIDQIELMKKMLKISDDLSKMYISGVVDIIEEDNAVYSISEFVEGKSLKTIIESGIANNDYNLVLSYMNQIAEAVDYIHRNGIAHGNIKPSNIILDDYLNRLRLIDFTKGCEGSRNSCINKGEIYYSSPEILGKDRISLEQQKDHDIWSSGVVFYQLANDGDNYIDFTGFEPDILEKNIIYLPVNPSRNSYQPINKIISLMLVKNPEDRIDSTGLTAVIYTARPGCEIDGVVYSRAEAESMLVQAGASSNVTEYLDSEICRMLTSHFKKCILKDNSYDRETLVKLADLLDIPYNIDDTAVQLCRLIDRAFTDDIEMYRIRATADILNLIDIAAKSRDEKIGDIYYSRYKLYKANDLIDIDLLKQVQKDVYSRYEEYLKKNMKDMKRIYSVKNNEIVDIILDFQPEISEYEDYRITKTF